MRTTEGLYRYQVVIWSLWQVAVAAGHTSPCESCSMSRSSKEADSAGTCSAPRHLDKCNRQLRLFQLPSCSSWTQLLFLIKMNMHGPKRQKKIKQPRQEINNDVTAHKKSNHQSHRFSTGLFSIHKRKHVAVGENVDILFFCCFICVCVCVQ